MKMTSKSLWL